MHNQNDAFVKRQGEELKKMAGKAPELDGKYMIFNAEMVNNGKHAQELGRKLTKGLDKKAFPVK